MNVTQILTLALTLLGIFTASWMNNTRMTDRKELFRAELKAVHAELDNRFTRLEVTIERNQKTIMRMLADHDQRIAKLEDGRRA